MVLPARESGGGGEGEQDQQEMQAWSRMAACMFYLQSMDNCSFGLLSDQPQLIGGEGHEPSYRFAFWP